MQEYKLDLHKSRFGVVIQNCKLHLGEAALGSAVGQAVCALQQGFATDQGLGHESGSEGW